MHAIRSLHAAQWRRWAAGTLGTSGTPLGLGLVGVAVRLEDASGRCRGYSIWLGGEALEERVHTVEREDSL